MRLPQSVFENCLYRYALDKCTFTHISMYSSPGHYPADVIIRPFLYTSFPHFLPFLPPPDLSPSLPVSLPHSSVIWFMFSPSLNRSGSRSSKTFKPKKHIPEGTHQYDLMKHAAATLGSGNLRAAVMLPEGEDLNEWVAVNSKCLPV